MSVRIFSDLHLEFGLEPIKKCIDICSVSRTKYIILAGDITNFPKKETVLPILITELKKYTDNIIYIIGNHEYYEIGNTNLENVLNSYKKISLDLGITLLENSFFETDDFVFYGTTMWSKPTELAFKRMNDRFSFRSSQEVIDIHENSKKLLYNFISEYNKSKPLVIITHHLPSFTLIDKEYLSYKEINTAFASELDYMIGYPIKYWIYGHTHKPNSTLINNILLLCNPHGYKHENKTFKDCVF